MAIDAKHSQYEKNIDKWTLIDRVVDEEDVDEYLIELNPFDTSDENKARNKAYKERAVFYALTSQTVAGMIGTVFSRVPNVTVPPELEYVKENIDGSGNSIYQQSQKVVRAVSTKSRDGLFTSFPTIESGKEITKQDVIDGKYVATTQRIDAKRITNWRKKSFGAINKLVFIVFKDTKVEMVDYVEKATPILRELFIDEDGFYKERRWVEVERNWVVDGEVLIPTDYAGQKWTEIPFSFVGSTDNDTDVNPPIMLGMAKLNIAHFRNSADFEDNVWYAGQSQPWMSGVDQDHVDLMKNNKMYAGSRNILAVPEGGVFDYASADPNPLIRQAMLDKVDMMIGIGARMITPGGVAKTAEQSSNERETQHSTLSLAVENVNEAYSKHLFWMGKYMGASKEKDAYAYDISTDFVKAGSSPQKLKEIIAGFIAGAVPVGDYVRFMKNEQIFDDDKDVEEYADDLGSVVNDSSKDDNHFEA